MRKAAFCQMLQNNPGLFRRIVAFNYRTAFYLHTSRVTQIACHRTYHQLLKSERGAKQLSRMICNAWALDPVGFWEFETTISRIGLFDFSQIEHLTKLVGATLFRQPLAHVIARDHLQEIRTAIGDDCYRFAVKRSPFLIPKLPENVLQLLTKAIDETTSFIQQIQNVGWEVLSQTLKDAPRAMTSRLNLKLPADSALQSETVLEQEDRRACVEIVEKIIDTEFSSEC
ncbi:MAG: SctK family type III secretion system sorting platform protein [Planctomycetota bacterium]